MTGPADVPRVSVVVPTRDRPDRLATCLAALERQTVPELEIVVVDDASRDAAGNRHPAQPGTASTPTPAATAVPASMAVAAPTAPQAGTAGTAAAAKATEPAAAAARVAPGRNRNAAAWSVSAISGARTTAASAGGNAAAAST